MDLCTGNLHDIILKEGTKPPEDELDPAEDEVVTPDVKILSEDLARNHFRQIIAAVEHAHKKLVVHRGSHDCSIVSNADMMFTRHQA